MIHLRQAIVVEGRYDKAALAGVVDAPVFTTGGFGIFNNREQLAFLRQVAQRRGLIILTDADSAGFVIRNYLKGTLPRDCVWHAYIPDVEGKESRKRRPGKEGKLGVEGMPPEVLLEALRRAGVPLEGEAPAAPGEQIGFTDLYEAGLSGMADAAARRARWQQALGLPARLGKQGFLDALNILMSREEFYQTAALWNETDEFLPEKMQSFVPTHKNPLNREP